MKNTLMKMIVFMVKWLDVAWNMLIDMFRLVVMLMQMVILWMLFVIMTSGWLDMQLEWSLTGYSWRGLVWIFVSEFMAWAIFMAFMYMCHLLWDWWHSQAKPTMSYVVVNFKYLASKDKTWSVVSGWIFMLQMFIVLHIWYLFDPFEIGFQYVYRLPLITRFNIEFIIGLDGISLCFLLLTVYIMALCWFAVPWQITTNYKGFIMCLLLIDFFLILSFMTIDLFFFYVFFESVLMPMFVLIGLWGARVRKIRAAYYFFLYTLFGSLFMLFGILYIYTMTGTTEYEVLLNTEFTRCQQLLLWFCFFIPFAVKIPMIPFHIWLPEAHVEAPTVGSMILASLLLKLGSYGFLSFTLPLFPMGSMYYKPLVYSLAVVSVIYASLVTIRQIDLKRMIAYSSVAHMNLIVLGLFSYTQQGIDGAIYLMIGHGVVSTALFFCVGVLYDRHHTRLLEYYGGLAQVMPIYSVYLFFFTLANMGFPGTSNFIGELLILVGLFEKNIPITLLAATGIVFSAIYSIWLYNSVIFGALKLQYFSMKSLKNFRDLTYMENFILFSLTVQMFLLGMHSNAMTELTQMPVSSIVLLGAC